MPIPNSIKDISVIPTSNSPLGSDNIGTSLDEYLRSIQAVARQESLNKSWERRNDTPTYINATTFTLVGNLTAFYTVNRAIKAIDSSIITGLITSSVFSSGVTTVITTWNSGNLTASLSEVQLGLETTAVKPALISSAMQPIVNAADVPTARNLLGINNQWVGNIDFSANGNILVTLPIPYAYTAGMSFTFRCSAVNSAEFTLQPTGQSIGAVRLLNPLVVGNCYTAFADGITGWHIFNANLTQGLIPSNNLNDLQNINTALANLRFGGNLTSDYNIIPNPNSSRDLILQSGSYTALANDIRTITLPFAFPNQFRGVFVDMARAGGNSYILRPEIISLSQFTVNTDYSGVNPTIAHYWFAIGN